MSCQCQEIAAQHRAANKKPDEGAPNASRQAEVEETQAQYRTEHGHSGLLVKFTTSCQQKKDRVKAAPPHARKKPCAEHRKIPSRRQRHPPQSSRTKERRAGPRDVAFADPKRTPRIRDELGGPQRARRRKRKPAVRPAVRGAPIPGRSRPRGFRRPEVRLPAFSSSVLGFGQLKSVGRNSPPVPVRPR